VAIALILASEQAASHETSILVIPEAHHDTSRPLRDLIAQAGAPPLPLSAHSPIAARRWRPQSSMTLAPILQGQLLPKVGTTDLLNFDGIRAPAGSNIPADPNGAVGQTQFVEWANASYAIYDKATGVLQAGPFLGTQLWQGFGGNCETDNSNDGIVLYDKMAQVWVLARPTLDSTPYYYCIAVSTGPDATGAYNRYAWDMGLNTNDYPKLGIWPDAYYCSFNIVTPKPRSIGPEACAVDRQAMLDGQTAAMQCFQGYSSSDTTMLPADVDGSVYPALGEPEFFLDISAPASAHTLHLWKFHVDFVTPSQSIFTGPALISVEPFTEPCDAGYCIPQPSPGAPLASRSDRLMFRLAWRNLQGTEHLLVNHTVTPRSGAMISAVRWYDLINPSETASIFQQGSVASSTQDLFMGSIAMDKIGDIALGFSTSSASSNPAIWYTGRVPTDPLGELESAKLIIKGKGVETRIGWWGDYTSMSIDPEDDCTFWYTNAYFAVTGTQWNTRMASFKFPSCT